VGKRDALQQALDALGGALAEPTSPEARAALGDALRSKRSFLVARAAESTRTRG
jgi:hypothetical protein